jgi:hypothetical protein
MLDSPASRDQEVTTLNAGQRDWIRRQARVTRALEAARRRGGSHFVRSAPELRGTAKRPPARPAA